MEVLMTNVEEMTKTPSGLFVLWLIFGGIVLDIGIRVLGAIRAHNTPPMHERFVERKIYDEFKQEMKQELESLNDALKDQAKESKVSRANLYSEIKSLGTALNERIDELPERILNILKFHNRNK